MTRNSDTRYDHESYRGGAETQTAKPGTGERNSSFKRGKCVLSRNKRFFRSEPLEVSKNLRMKFIAIKTDDGTIKGKIAFYCGTLNVTRQGFYWYLKHRNIPWKYEDLAEKIRTIEERISAMILMVAAKCIRR